MAWFLIGTILGLIVGGAAWYDFARTLRQAELARERMEELNREIIASLKRRQAAMDELKKY